MTNGEIMFYINQTSIPTGGIVALKSDDVFSLKPLLPGTEDGIRRAQHIARGELDIVGRFADDLILEKLLGLSDYNKLIRPADYAFEVRPFLEQTASFDFADLENPVPADVYFDARNEDCWGRQSHCGTITDDTYQPRLYLRNSIWRSILPSEYRCSYPTVVDPPIALSRLPFQELAAPTLAHPAASVTPVQPVAQQPPSEQARPGNLPGPELPFPTEYPGSDRQTGATNGHAEGFAAEPRGGAGGFEWDRPTRASPLGNEPGHGKPADSRHGDDDPNGQASTDRDSKYRPSEFTGRSNGRLKIDWSILLVCQSMIWGATVLAFVTT